MAHSALKGWRCLARALQSSVQARLVGYFPSGLGQSARTELYRRHINDGINNVANP